MPFVLFGGLLSNSDNYMQWIGWLQYCSPVRYAFEAIMRNEFEGAEIQGPGDVDILDQLGFNVGFDLCLVLLAVIGGVCRLMSVFFLKRLAGKF